MKLSVVIPAHNEEGCISAIIGNLIKTLEANKIEREIIVVNDNSTDNTPGVLEELTRNHKEIKVINAPSPRGFGRAIRKGIENATGDIVVTFMGDGSDAAEDVIKYYNKIQEGFDCVFGSRFIKGSQTSGYPKVKFILNRMGNALIQLLFWIKYNDVSNAFKAYRTEVIRAVQPLVSQYFNITVEIPLKAIIRGFSFAVVPINWNGRVSGVSKYNIGQLSKKYFFSILFIWLEKILLKEEIKTHPK